MVHGLVAHHCESPGMKGMLAALLVAAALGIAAPSAVAQHRQFGAKAGPSFTGIALAEDDGQTYHPRIAAAIGGFLVLPITSRLAVQFEAMSSPKGTRLEEPGTNLAQTLMLRYFELPVLARVSGPDIGPGVLYFLAGPFLGVRQSAKEQLSDVSRSVVAGVREDATDAIERFEHGLIVGAGIDLGRRLLIEGRYSHGLSNANRVAGATHFTNRGFSFTTGVRF